MTDREREDVERELALSWAELYERMLAPPVISGEALERWRIDLRIRRREIARISAILEEG